MHVRGEDVVLRRTATRDLADLLLLWNDGRVMRWVGYPDGLGYDREQVERWLEEVDRDSSRHHFVVLDREARSAAMSATPST